ncbi:MAG: HAMP domain-containing histidine kinase [Oscillospiraceae bacterium]|nr:HAMP domain-containing histidine kinase [Oscillospiraceae bacterium]
MKKLKKSLAAKIIALILFCIFTLTLAASAVLSLLLEGWGAYSADREQTKLNAMQELAWSHLYAAHDMLESGVDGKYILRDTNFRFSVADNTGKKLFSNYKSEEIICRVITDIEPRYHIQATVDAGIATAEAENSVPVYKIVRNDTGEVLEIPAGEELEKWVEENSLHMTGYVLKDMSVKDNYYWRSQVVDRLYPYKYELIIGAAVSAVLMFIVLAFLMAAAGHRKDSEEIVLSPVDKIPLDIFAVCAVAAIGIPISIMSEMNIQPDMYGFTVISMFLIWIVATALISLASLAVRVKTRTLIKNCLCIKILFWCWNLLKKLIIFAFAMIKSISMNKRFVLFAALVLFMELCLMVLSGLDAAMSFFLWVLNIAAALVFFAYIVYCFTKLRAGAKELAAGSLTCSIDTKYMRGEFLEHANDMMNIRSGLTRAVNERMKSERFQSELITNVSHDIKTPLTSIINYVDLLDKEELNNGKAREYVDVLSRQSAKLKKLLGDLIEASKASTGVLAVNAERCELGVLLDQCAGEYSERLQKANLRLLVSKPETPITIMADGRHMWRILDNLMGNVLKYAQPGTRVYLNLEQDAERARISLRNISRDELNISGEELMERFVRGDSSRSTEGSGLGLAIARSLCTLQGGEMSLNVDGDLFKIIITFNTIK